MRYKLILFDIDGTLITTGRAGTRAMDSAFLELFGVAGAFRDIPMAGRTDPTIIRDGMVRCGIGSQDGHYNRYLEHYLEHLQREMAASTGKRVMPGIVPILETLGSRHMPVLGLLTGNLEAGARIKLEHLGIHHYFELGAYGSDHDDRNRLLGVAMERFQRRYGQEISPSDVMVVGDTPKDIACSKPFGATSVAVATGPYSRAELSRHEPAHLFDDLSDVDAFLRLILE